jgi:hypothetical protein
LPAWITFTGTCGNDEASSSLIAARTTARLAPHGRVLVLVPTLDLLSPDCAVLARHRPQRTGGGRFFGMPGAGPRWREPERGIVSLWHR